MKLTDRSIAALQPPTGGQKLYADDSISGFGVRVSAGGAKAFVLTLGIERRRITLGRYPIVTLAQARAKAKNILAARQLGLDKPPSPYFEDVKDEYLADGDRKVRSITRARDGYLFPHFKAFDRKRIAEIDPKNVQCILDGIKAQWTRRQCLFLMNGLIRFAEKQGYVSNWPLQRLQADISHTPRDRVLDTAELIQILTTAKTWQMAGNQFGDIIELLVLTGQRRQQIGSLDRSHVDFDEGTITWPAELMKTNKRHTIPMGDSVRALLEPRRTNALYFPNLHGEPFSAWSIHIKKFTRDCGFDDWVLHDLRRTLATRWQETGIDIATTEKMLSHSAITGGLVGVYQRSTYLTQMRAAVQKWEDHIQRLLSTTEATYA